MHSPSGEPVHFHTTHWTTVWQARDHATSEGTAALDRLCRTYWRPLYYFARRKGVGSHDAEDLVQAFFTKLLEKDYLRSLGEWSGRFRTFLLTAFSRFAANEWDRARRLKRGGAFVLLPLDTASAEEGYRLEPAERLTPEILFDRHWGETVVQLVINRLQAEYAASGEMERFEALRLMLLGDVGQVRYVDLGVRLGLSEAGVKTLVRRMRLQFAAILREELLQTLLDPADVETEMRYLLEALAR